MLIDTSVLQLYEKSRCGMLPFGLPVDAEKWLLEEEINQFKYEERHTGIYLVF